MWRVVEMRFIHNLDSIPYNAIRTYFSVTNLWWQDILCMSTGKVIKKYSNIPRHFGYTLYFGLVFPAIKSAAWDIIGKSRMVRRPGSCLATVRTVGRKFPNRFRKPKPSRAIPIRPHLMTTSAMPRKKQIVALIRSRLIYKSVDEWEVMDKTRFCDDIKQTDFEVLNAH